MTALCGAAVALPFLALLLPVVRGGSGLPEVLVVVALAAVGPFVWLTRRNRRVRRRRWVARRRAAFDAAYPSPAELAAVTPEQLGALRGLLRSGSDPADPG